MATYVPLMEKAKNTFLTDIKNGYSILLNSCEKFEYDMNILSYSFITSISKLSQILGYQTTNPELIQIFTSFHLFLVTTENEFNSQLKSVINRFHLLKNDYASHIGKGLNIINDGIKEELLLQVKYKRIKEVDSKSSNFYQFLKEKIKNLRDQIFNLHEEVQHIQNSFIYNLQKYKERTKKTINSMKNESNFFMKKTEIFENENDKKFKANTNDNNNYYLLINNIENETELINKLELKYEKEIKFINNENDKERKKYIDSFKRIHDKICENMDEVNLLHKELNQLKIVNEKEENETRSLFELEENDFREKDKFLFLLKKEVLLEIHKTIKENEIEYIKEKERSKQRIEIEKQKEEIECKKMQNFLNKKHQNFLNEIISSDEQFLMRQKIENELETKYNECLQQLTSPVFSTVIGYERSKVITNLIEKKNSIINNISNERNHLITKSKSEIVPRKNKFKTQTLNPNFFIQISNDEKDLLKKLWNLQIESATKVRQKEKEKLNELRKIRKDLNLTRRVYLTKKIYVLDEFNSFDYSYFIDQLKNDEKIDSQIENYEDRLFIHLIEFETKNNWNNKKIKQLEIELDRLNNSFNRIFEKFYKLRKSSNIQNKEQKLVQNQKNENHTRNILRSKSSQSPNVISPVSSKIGRQKKNFS